MQNTTTLHNVDFAKLIKTLESCQTAHHLETTRKMYRNFEKKWSNKISRPEIIEYMTKFLSLYREVNQMSITQSLNTTIS